MQRDRLITTLIYTPRLQKRQLLMIEWCLQRLASTSNPAAIARIARMADGIGSANKVTTPQTIRKTPRTINPAFSEIRTLRLLLIISPHKNTTAPPQERMEQQIHYSLAF
jgi:hypothetical protein